MTQEELCELEYMIDRFESYLFKKYNRTNGHQTTIEYAHKIISSEIEPLKIELSAPLSQAVGKIK